MTIRGLLKIGATVVTFGLGALLLASGVLVYIPPSILGYFAYVGFIFPVLFVLNFLSFLYWAIQWRTRMLLPLTVLVFMLPLWNKTFQMGWQLTPSRLGHAQELTILSYNVRMFDVFDWSKIPGNSKRIFEFIKQKDADVICIQEFYATKNSGTYSEETINESFKKYKYRQIYYDAGEGVREFGMAVYSKYPIVSKEFLRFPNTSNSSVVVDIMVKGKRVRIFNNHLESIRLTQENINFLDSINYQSKKSAKRGVKEITTKLTGAFACRSNQADRIASLSEHSPYPVFMCGDFNDTPVSYVYHTMKGHLQDSFVENGSGFGGTYHGLPVPFRIDFLFHSSSIINLKYQEFKVPYSDHYPIYGKFLL